MSKNTDTQCRVKISNSIGKASFFYSKSKIYACFFDLITWFLGERFILTNLGFHKPELESSYVCLRG